jgi:hypothetical protein
MDVQELRPSEAESDAWWPAVEDLERERRYWQDLDRIAEYDAWIEMQAMEQAELDDLGTWPLADLIEELETARTLTPDQEDIIAELEAEIARRGVAA